MNINIIILVIAAYFFIGHCSYSQELYNLNLIVNGDAELFTAGVQTPAWQNTFGDEPETETYGHTGGEYDWDWGKERGYGEGYFRAAIIKPDPRYISQVIDVSAISNDIDAGKVLFSLSGMFAAGEGASTRLESVFKDNTGKKLKAFSTEALKPNEQGNGLEYTAKNKTGEIPKGTTQVEIILHFEYIEDCMNCSTMALADNLSFVLNKKEN